MSHKQFDAAVKVTAADPESRTTQAAKLVLVEGYAVNRAARMAGINNAPVYRAVKRLRAVAHACPACGRPL